MSAFAVQVAALDESTRALLAPATEHLSRALGDSNVHAVLPVKWMGWDGMLVCASDRIFFASLADADVISEPLESIFDIYADAQTEQLVVDFDDDSPMPFEVSDLAAAERFIAAVPRHQPAQGQIDPDHHAFVRDVSYLGGHPDAMQPLPKVDVMIGGGGIGIYPKGRSDPMLLWIDREDILEVSAGGSAEIRQRVTVPRVLALGIFALAVPKKSKFSYLVVCTAGGDMIFEVQSRTALQLRADLQPFHFGEQTHDAATSPSPPDPDPNTRPITQRLAQLGELHGSGLITDDEFATRRMEILREI